MDRLRLLDDDETRLVPYDKLSRGKKMEMDNTRRAALGKAKKDAEKNPVTEAILDVANSPANIFMPKKNRDEMEDIRRRNDADRASRVNRAQDDADYKDTKKAGSLYVDDVVHKTKGMKKGGVVKKAKPRGWGIAR